MIESQRGEGSRGDARFRQPMPTSNLFLALFPDIYSATQLTDLANSQRANHCLKGEPIAQPRFHLSLHRVVFDDLVLHQIVRNVGAAVEEAAGPVPPFWIELDRVVSFRGSGAFVLFSRTANSVLQQFRQGLGAALRRYGVRCDRSKFQPRVTLLYDRDRSVAEQVVEPVRWVANEVVLVQSLLGEGEYRILERWKLRG